MHVVVVSNLYPNSQEPTRGIYTQQLVHQLCEHVNVRVVAPLAWRPRFLNTLKKTTPVPHYEILAEVEVWHPRYFVIPKTARCLYGACFFLGVFQLLKRLHQAKPIDVINVHWAYPDAVGVVYAAKKLGIPVVTHALGCDVNEFGKYQWRRQQIAWAFKESTMSVFVSQALLDVARSMGVKHDRCRVVLNGVDQNKFHLGDQTAARQALNLPLDKQLVLFAGNYNIEKGLIYLIDAWKSVSQACPNAHLCVVGSGPEEQMIQERIKTLGHGEHISLLGRVAHELIPQYLHACEFLCLPSLREGCPNIVLEALSSGVIVISSKVGAVPELVDASRGMLVTPEDSQALSETLIEALNGDWQRQAWPWMSWADNALKVLEIYREAIRIGV